MKLKCQIGLHSWSNWTKPKTYVSDKLYGYAETTQTKVCNECGKTVIHEL